MDSVADRNLKPEQPAGQDILVQATPAVVFTPPLEQNSFPQLGWHNYSTWATRTYNNQFEELKMMDSETVDEFATRLTSLISRIRNPNGKLDETEVVHKFLLAAPACYIKLVTTIEQFIDHKTLSIKDLLGCYETLRSIFGNPQEGKNNDCTMHRQAYRTSSITGTTEVKSEEGVHTTTRETTPASATPVGTPEESAIRGLGS